jgi:hypothetical protein
MEHATCHKEPLQKGTVLIRAIPLDFQLLEYLWQARLIDDLDLEELALGNHTLAIPPLTRTRWMEEKAEKWESPVER